MPATTNCVLEVRPTGTSTNGGGFDPTIVGAGTDYSQQNAAQATAADGVTNGTTTFTSASALFTAAMVGNVINIVGTGRYVVSGYNSTTSITLNATVSSATGLTWYLGGALDGLATASGVAQPGNTVWVGNGSAGYSTATNIAVTAAGGDGAPITFIGYAVARGDSGYATFTCSTGTLQDAVLTFSGNFVQIANFKINANGNAWFGLKQAGEGDQWMTNCWGLNAIFVGIYVNHAGVVYRCKGSSNGATGGSDSGNIIGGFQVTFPALLLECDATGNLSYGSGFTAQNCSPTFIRCLAWDNSRHGFRQYGSQGLRLLNCNSDRNAADGLNILGVFDCNQSTFINCVFTNNGGYGMNSPGFNYAVQSNALFGKLRFMNNAFYNNILGNYNQMPVGTGDIYLTTDPYNSGASGDFSLNSTPGGGGSLRGTGLPGAFGAPGSPPPSTSYLDVGAVQSRVPIAPAVAGTAPIIDEVQFPVQISEGATGGAAFSTIVVVAGNGQEQRTPLYTHGRYKWNAGPGMKSPSDMAVATAFWLARQGKARGFRWKDWDDFQASAQALTINGTPTAQLVKTYTSGGITYTRIIYKPQQNNVAVSIQRNGSGYASWTLDTTTGIVTWTPIIQKAISGITAASSAVVTVPTGHGFVVGDIVYFTGIVGMTQMNGLTGSVTATASTTITVAINSSAFTGYTSGGTASKYPQPSDAITWTGEFDVPVRFDTDEQMMVQEAATYRSWSNLPVIELTGG